MSTTSELVERLKALWREAERRSSAYKLDGMSFEAQKEVEHFRAIHEASARLEELERENARLTSEVEKITRWANASLDSVKTVMWSYETALLNIEGHLSNHIETHKKVDVAIAVAYETARAALAGSGEK